jgi:tetratricopeptide (TPR) repeat protein
MKAVFRITILVAAVVIIASTTLQAQRIIKGTVYRDGEPAAGITVEAHRGGSMMTSFDGKYEVEAHEKTKWLKFTYINETKKLDIDDKQGDVFDFAFTGEIPSGDAEEESGEVILKSAEELIRDQNRDFMNELSLFTEFYKQENWKSALPHWKNVYNKYPKSTKNIYIQGVKMHESLIENAETQEEREKYIDQLMKIYDKRIKYFGEEGYVLGRKATAYLEYKLNTDNPPEGDALKETLKKGYDWLNQSIELQQGKTELPIYVLLMQTTRSLFKLDELPKETVVKNYDMANTLLNTYISETEEQSGIDDANKVKAYIEEIFGSSGAADCEALVNIFAPQYENNKDDAEFIKSMLRRLGNAGCEESPLFANATERLYELEPSAEAAFNMARRFVQRDETEKAKNYYQQAMEQETDEERLSKYYYEYALFIFAKENDLPEARNYAKKALDINPDYCQALMLIGDIYLAASRSYGDDDFEQATVFWVAVDYYERARRAGQDCAIEAAEKARQYRNHFPNKEEAFFRDLKEGQTYTIGGWINETTKVRF